MDPLYSRPRRLDTEGILFTAKWTGIIVVASLVVQAGLDRLTPPSDTANRTVATNTVIDSASKPKLQWLDKPDILISKKVGRPQKITATAFLVADVDTGQVLVSRQPALQLPIASLTKLVTALTALRAGAPSSVQELFYPLLMESSNVAADQIAGIYDGLGNVGYFVSQMNRQAALLDMTHTAFADPSGLSGQNRSTAYDLLLLAKSVKDLQPDILTVTKTRQKTVMLDGGRLAGQPATVYAATDGPVYRDLQNINLFVNDPRFLGGKTGYTSAAGETLISLFRLPIQDSSRNVVFIILGSDAREKDFGILMKWLETATK